MGQQGPTNNLTQPHNFNPTEPCSQGDAGPCTYPINGFCCIPVLPQSSVSEVSEPGPFGYSPLRFYRLSLERSLSFAWVLCLQNDREKIGQIRASGQRPL